MAKVSDCFFFKRIQESKSEKKNCFLLDGLNVREDWLKSEFVLWGIQI